MKIRGMDQPSAIFLIVRPVRRLHDVHLVQLAELLRILALWVRLARPALSTHSDQVTLMINYGVGRHFNCHPSPKPHALCSPSGQGTLLLMFDLP